MKTPPDFKKVLLLAVCLTYLLYIVGCGRYDGHNGYFFAWKDFESVHLVEADLDTNGVTTHEEMQAFTADWLKSKGLTKRDGFYQVYDGKGKPVCAADFVSKF